MKIGPLTITREPKKPKPIEPPKPPPPPPKPPPPPPPPKPEPEPEPPKPPEQLKQIGEQKPKGLTATVAELTDILSNLKKKVKKGKEFKLPAKIRAAAKKAATKNKVMIILLKTNRTITVTIGQIKDGVIQIGEKFYNASMAFVYLYKKIPTLIIPEWNLNPIGTEDYYQAVKDKTIIDPQTVIIKAIEAKESIMSGKKMGGKAIIFILIAAVVVIYVLMGKG